MKLIFNTFEFINATPTNLPSGQAARTLIRKQAMKEVAAVRRQRGNYGKHNLKQFPVFLSASPPASYSSQLDDKQMYDQIVQESFILDPPSLLQGDYLGLVISEHFSILNICPFASLHLGIAKISHFSTQPVHIRDIFVFPFGRASLLSFVPSRYKKTICMTYAADCVVQRLRCIVNGKQSAFEERVCTHLYVRALKCLQAALDDKEACMAPETLCATELLSIFELLDTQNETSWILHASGATRLIRHRGPTRFNTDFEKALFVSHAGPIVTEAFINGTPCDLAEQAWQDVFRSSILTSELWGERSELVMSLWVHLAAGPGLFKLAEDLIHLHGPADQASVDSTIEQIQHSREVLLKWHLEHKKDLPPIDDYSLPENLHPREPIPFLAVLRQLQLHAAYISCLIVISRLLVALAPVRFGALESQCQGMAERIIKLRTQLGVAEQPILCGMFTTQTWWIARATIQTRVEWCSNMNVDTAETIKQEIFDSWCRALGRRPADKTNNNCTYVVP